MNHFNSLAAPLNPTKASGVTRGSLTEDRLAALARIVEAGRIEVRYATSPAHYLANAGLLRKTTHLFADPRYGRVPVEVYVPTQKGRAALAA